MLHVHPSSRLVEETLEPLDPDRRAFRLVGGVLVRQYLFVCLFAWREGHPRLDSI
jgi:hypothetical protein